jgi:gas vesicle protein
MAERNGGFYWGLLVGGAIGCAVGIYLSTESGRERLDSLKARTIELTGDPEDLKQRAVRAATTVRSAVGDAIQEGVGAARERRRELAEPVGREVASTPVNSSSRPQPGPGPGVGNA